MKRLVDAFGLEIFFRQHLDRVGDGMKESENLDPKNRRAVRAYRNRVRHLRDPARHLDSSSDPSANA